MNKKPWFGPKRYGYGSGLPIAWQGWVVLLVYIVAVSASSFVFLLFPDLGIAAAIYTALVLAATLILMVICACTTEGGWHWRWDGKKPD